MTRYISQHNPSMPQMAAFIEQLGREGIPHDSTIIYRGRNTVYTTNIKGNKLNIKAFKKTNSFNAYIYTTLRKSKAHRSYLNALRLLDLGINTPQPIGYGEVIDKHKLTYSYYVSEQIDVQNIRNWEEKADCEPLLRAFAKEIIKFHQAGVWHKDFSGGNILYSGNEVTGYKFYYVDLNRMEFGVKSRRKLMTMFRDMNHSAIETEKIARYYAQETGEDPDKIVQEALKAHNKCKHTRQRKKWLKSLFKWRKKA